MTNRLIRHAISLLLILTLANLAASFVALSTVHKIQHAVAFHAEDTVRAPVNMRCIYRMCLRVSPT